ncbi:3TM-type holin [Vibrio harveyi]|uniref:3TM-type holin n=1 Tax=Vibrio harveyi TaxID=669 RepID=UPI0025B0A289|nr:3TM-type holin [Vibrio harveyi]WJT10852.1 3TM-type holin [Vibrio harveyi]
MWDRIKALIAPVAPVVGGLVGGPVGATVGTLLSNALGVEATPEAIEQELKRNPDALVKIKQMESDERTQLRTLTYRHAELESEERKLSIVQQHKTMQAELKSEDAYVRRWRPTFGYAVCLAWSLLFFGLFIVMVITPEKAAEVINSVVAMTPLFGIALTVLGINIHKRSLDKQTQAGITPKTIKQLKDSLAGVIKPNEQ